MNILRPLRGRGTEPVAILRYGPWQANEHGERIRGPVKRIDTRCKIDPMTAFKKQQLRELSPSGARFTDGATFYMNQNVEVGEHIEARGREWVVVAIREWPEYGFWEVYAASGTEDA